MQFDDLQLNYSSFLPKDQNAAILDIGCGRGRVLSFLKQKGFENLTAFDRDGQAVAWVRQNITANASVESDVLGFLRARRASFDLIIAKDVIYYFPKLQTVTHLQAMREALKPGGTLIVEVFNGAALSGHFIGLKDYHIDWIPTEFSLRSMLEEAGFQVKQMSALIPPKRSLKRRIFNALGALWRFGMRAAYFFERGLDPQNPRIFTTKMVAIAEVRS